MIQWWVWKLPWLKSFWNRFQKKAYYKSIRVWPSKGYTPRKWTAKGHRNWNPESHLNQSSYIFGVPSPSTFPRVFKQKNLTKSLGIQDHHPNLQFFGFVRRSISRVYKHHPQDSMTIPAQPYFRLYRPWPRPLLRGWERCDHVTGNGMERCDEGLPLSHTV